ncbi:MAG: alpha/beta fold hydrolase [Elusimicrobia bacterium]|nr:alpha/beta fold hydrolase [Elusimicrobiota bacterium]MDE2312902.1 alpha/beta fold hydrolase [Elusimicrobiota bacterium]
MIWILLAVILLGLGAILYWGAGVILYPPSMSAMEVFPESFGLPYERIAFQTEDGLTLKGWFVPAPDANKDRTLLMCHGWSDNKGELLKMTAYLHQAGFNLFYFDFRSHGESQGEFTTLGHYELRDLRAAMNCLKEKKPWCLENLGVFGFSMGAAVAAMGAGDYPEIRAVILESPFTEFHRVCAQWTKNHLHIPYFPLVMGAIFVLRLRAGLAVGRQSPINSIARISPKPLLVIGGTADTLMPESGVRQLYAAAGEPKQLWIISGAAHGKCHETAGLAYERRVIGFFEKNLLPVPRA